MHPRSGVQGPSYSGYGHYDSDEMMDNIGEMGQSKNLGDYGAARKKLTRAANSQQETQLKAARNYGGSAYVPNLALPEGVAHQHFGQIIICCERADLRPTAKGITVYSDDQKHIETLDASNIPRIEVIDELCAAVIQGISPRHGGQWARATTAVCLALLESARTQSEQRPMHQIKP